MRLRRRINLHNPLSGIAVRHIRPMQVERRSRQIVRIRQRRPRARRLHKEDIVHRSRGIGTP